MNLPKKSADAKGPDDRMCLMSDVFLRMFRGVDAGGPLCDGLATEVFVEQNRLERPKKPHPRRTAG